MENDFSLLSLIFSGLRLSTPLLFAALGGLISERSGVANIALEGFLLVGAFSAAAITASFGNPYLGLAACVLAGAAIASVFALLTVYGRGDHIVMGTAVNLLVIGSLPMISKYWFGASGSTPSIPIERRLDMWSFFVAAILFAGVIRWLLARSKWGLRLRASGENIAAAESLGVSVKRTRFWAVVVSGAITALGGAFLSIAHGSQYARGMSAGRGFIALAALILAGWRPMMVIVTCLVFGLADAAQILFQSFELPGGGTLPVQWIQMFPYIVTVLVLIFFVGRTAAPEAIGKNTESL